MRKKSAIIIIVIAALLIIWQKHTLKKRIAALSGPFNDIITVCINSIPIQNDTAFKHAGAHYKYDRFIPHADGMQKQTCYVKLIFNREKNHLPAGRYSCSIPLHTRFFGMHSNIQQFNNLTLQPCAVDFNRNTKLKKQYKNIDKQAQTVENMQKGIELLKTATELQK